MQMTSRLRLPFVTGPGEGRHAPIGRLDTIHKVPGYVMNGRVALVEHTLPSRFLSCPRHRHAREDELSIVLDGTLSVLLGDQVVTATPGSYVLKPRGQWHAVWSEGPGPARFIELLIPGGLEGYLDRMAQLLSNAHAPERDEVRRLADEYGVEFDFDGIGPLCQRFGLELG